jgi:alanyl-tRNA synthetase
VHASGEIGLFKLHFEGGVAAGVRRVEAFTGEGALELMHSYEDRLREIGALVRGTPEDAADKVRRLLDHQKDLEKEIEKLRGQFEQDPGS